MVGDFLRDEIFIFRHRIKIMTKKHSLKIFELLGDGMV